MQFQTLHTICVFCLTKFALIARKLSTINYQLSTICAFCILLFAFCPLLSAQQETQFTQFMYNKLMVNPGYAGAREKTTLTALYRNQWAGFKGNPSTYLVSADGAFLSSRLGGSVVLLNQDLGVTKTQSASLGLSYAIIQEDDIALRVGLNASARRFVFDSQLNGAYVKEATDNTIPNNFATQTLGNLGAGVYLDVKDYYVGLSVPNLYENVATPKANGTVNISNIKRHYYAMAGAYLQIERDLYLKPSILVKYVPNAPFNADINLSIMFKHTFSAGLSYRMGENGDSDSIDLLSFYQLTDDLGFGVSYDYGVSALSSSTKGSFEAVIRYNFTSIWDSENPFARKHKTDHPRYNF